MELTVRIVVKDMADLDFGERSAGEGRAHLFLGIQKGQEVIETVPVTAGTATFTAFFSVSPLPDGATNFLGPYAQGTRDARFFYLCWMAEDAAGMQSMFSRIKLPLSSLRWERVEAAARAGTPIVMRLSGRGKDGRPVRASLPNDAIQWEG